MTDIIYVISMDNGVMLRTPATWEHKHYSREDADEVGETLAQKLGGTYLYMEEME